MAHRSTVVWSLFARDRARRPAPTLIERDNDVPAFEVLLAGPSAPSV